MSLVSTNEIIYEIRPFFIFQKYFYQNKFPQTMCRVTLNIQQKEHYYYLIIREKVRYFNI